MSFLRQRLGKWAAPVMVSALVLVVGGVSTAIGAKFITGKKVVKTITKKTQGNVQQVQGNKDLTTPSFDLNQPSALIASLPLGKGSYMVSTTALVSRNSVGVVVNCELRIGNKIDKTSIFTSTGTTSTDMALAAGGFNPPGGSAQLRCSDGSALANQGSVRHIEISALKVPKLRLTTAP